MSWKRILPFCCVLWAIAAGHPAAAEPRTLCFFSLNNANEYELTRSFIEQTNGRGQTYLRAFEFHNPDSEANPEASFRRMVGSGATCDGLVISGHHTGSFSGMRAEGVLDISSLERLSCDPDYSDFFRQVKAVWLQGCRTLGVGPVAVGGEDAAEHEADYHMQRVGAELIEDGLTQSFAQLSLEFSATLDQDNPLASRYMRVFPDATVFGWTRSSPGIKASSERSMLYHMSHMTHLSKGVPLFNPVTARPSLRRGMADSMRRVLEGNRQYGDLAKRAWISHGHVRQSGLGYDNPDLNAYSPLLDSSREDLLAARGLGCDLRNSDTLAETQGALRAVLANRAYTAYNLNAVWDSFQGYRETEGAEYELLRAQLVASNSLLGLLESKLLSPQTGLPMKIEYYGFYKELTGRSSDEVEARIRENVRYFLLARDLAGTEYDIRDFREALLMSLARHDLAGPTFYLGLLRSPDLQGDTLYALTWTFLKHSTPDAGITIRQIVEHPRADGDTLRAASLWLLNNGTDENPDSLATIVAHPHVDEPTLGTVASVLAKYDQPDAEPLAAAIVAHPRAGSLALSQVTLALYKHGEASDPELLSDILSHPALDKWGLQNVARALGKSAEPASAGLVNNIVNHEQVDATTLSTVAIALGNADGESQPELLQSIQAHPRADARTQEYIERVLASNRQQNVDEDFF